MCHKTTARNSLQNRAAVYNLSLTNLLHQYKDDTVHEAQKIELLYDQLLEPINQPSNSVIRNFESPIENKPSFIDKNPFPSPLISINSQKIKIHVNQVRQAKKITTAMTSTRGCHHLKVTLKNSKSFSND